MYAFIEEELSNSMSAYCLILRMRFENGNQDNSQKGRRKERKEGKEVKKNENRLKIG